MSKDPKNSGQSNSDIVSKNLKNKAERRKLHNKEIIQKMKDGESLSSFDSMESWFPPRPTIKKDKKVMEKLYATDKPRAKPTLSKSTSKPAESSSALDSSGDSNSVKQSRKSDKKSKVTVLREVK